MINLIIPSLKVNVLLNSYQEVKDYVYSLHNHFEWLRGSTWDWDNSYVEINGVRIGRVSYNGTVWDKHNRRVID
ncbi:MULTISPECIES: hypothetical protein [unclassified Psychrobacillus]|uniref:hypothetical protein n=1 Tax=unclassified Psychrobacillus TaxID=2636677 RepID=UPI0030FCAC8A